MDNETNHPDGKALTMQVYLETLNVAPVLTVMASAIAVAFIVAVVTVIREFN